MRYTVVVGLIILAALEACSHARPRSTAPATPAEQPAVRPAEPPAAPASRSPSSEAGPAATTPTQIIEPAPAVREDRPGQPPAPRPAVAAPAATAAPDAVAPGKSSATAAATAARPAATAPAKPTSTTAVPAPAAPAATPAPPAPPSLDLASLEQRLRDTHAIGVFTKLSLKNQVDELLGQFRAYHRGNKTVPASQLRQRYDGLVMKVLSVLQDGDPPLAAQIWSSREAIWGILADPAKFEKI